MRVSFIPLVDDYVLLATRFNRSEYDRSLDRYAYLFFIFLNVGCFPAYLLFIEKYLLGFGFFIFNLAFYLTFISGMTERQYRKHFERSMRIVDDPTVTVELTSEAIECDFSGDQSRIIWKNVSEIEERSSTILIYYRNSAIGIPKSAFSTELEMRDFLSFAQSNLRSNI